MAEDDFRESLFFLVQRVPSQRRHAEPYFSFSLIPTLTPEPGVFDLASRLHNAIGGHTYEGLVEGERITVSAGFVTFVNGNIESYENFIRMADDAIQQRKNRASRI